MRANPVVQLGARTFARIKVGEGLGEELMWISVRRWTQIREDRPWAVRGCGSPSDASFSVCGIVRGELRVDVVQAVGRIEERRRLGVR